MLGASQRQNKIHMLMKYILRMFALSSFITGEHWWKVLHGNTGELGYDGPLYDRFLHMTGDMLGPSPMHIKYLVYI